MGAGEWSELSDSESCFYGVAKAIWVGPRLIVGHGTAARVDEQLVEVPWQLLGLALLRVVQGRVCAEVLEHLMAVASVHVGLLREEEVHTSLLRERLDVCGRAWLLIAKLVAGEAHDGKAPGTIIFVHLS